MTVTRLDLTRERFYRFNTDRGSVVVRVFKTTPPSVEVYELAAVLSAVGKSDAAFRASPEAVAARNRFGPALMRRIFRVVQADHPDVTAWRYDRTTRAIRTGPKVLEVS